MPKITFAVYNQCLSSSITALIDAFSICNSLLGNEKNGDERPPSLFEMEIAAVNKEPVLTNGSVWIQPDAEFKSVKQTDLILIPPRLHAKLPEDEELNHILPWIKDSYQNGVRVGTLCTGSFVLALTGLLDGRTATTNWLFIDKFRECFPKVILKPERILTDDLGLICSGTITAMYNLVLYIIEIFGSAELSHRCSRILLVDHNRKSQLPYMVKSFRKEHGDTQIMNAQIWLEKNFAERFSIDEVAHHAGLSPRHFKRRFKQVTGESPLKYLQQMRLEKAKNMLEENIKDIEAITSQVGYEDSRTFRRFFKQYTSLSPREYRDRFRHN